VLIAGALIAALHLATGAPQLALVSVTRLFCGTVLGLCLSLTTRHTDLIDVLERRLAPLRRTGLDVGALSLMLALMLRFTEHFFVQWQQLDEAHRLRTGRPGRLRLLAPLTIQMLEAARRVADTLHVRLGR
jgi:biotin transport system permease protein